MDDVDLRISDADRERIGEVLREAHGEGRIEVTELQRRLDSVWQARTYRDVQPLVADLPRPGRPQQAPVNATSGSPHTPAPRSTGRRVAQTVLRTGWAIWAFVVMVNVVVWGAAALTSDVLPVFWPVWVAGPWGSVLLAGTLAEWTTRPRG